MATAEESQLSALFPETEEQQKSPVPCKKERMGNSALHAFCPNILDEEDRTR